MNYESVENLSEEKILELYEDVIENDSLSWRYWTFECDDGYNGYFCENSNYSSYGHCIYFRAASNATRRDFGVSANTCGTGQFGYFCIISEEECLIQD